jgi:hypothetical protein
MKKLMLMFCLAVAISVTSCDKFLRNEEVKPEEKEVIAQAAENLGAGAAVLKNPDAVKAVGDFTDAVSEDPAAAQALENLGASLLEAAENLGATPSKNSKIESFFESLSLDYIGAIERGVAEAVAQKNRP